MSILDPLRGCNSNLAQYSNNCATQTKFEHEDEHERRTPNVATSQVPASKKELGARI